MRGHWWVYYALKAVEKELGWMPTQAQVLGWTMVAMLGVFPKTMRHVCRNERGALFGWGMFPLLVALHGQDMSNVFFRSLEGNDLISHFLVHEDGKYSVVQHEVGTVIEGAVMLSYGGVEAYGYHGLEGRSTAPPSPPRRTQYWLTKH